MLRLPPLDLSSGRTKTETRISGGWRSWLAHQHDTLGVTGSSPVPPIVGNPMPDRNLPIPATRSGATLGKRGQLTVFRLEATQCPRNPASAFHRIDFTKAAVAPSSRRMAVTSFSASMVRGKANSATPGSSLSGSPRQSVVTCAGELTVVEVARGPLPTPKASVKSRMVHQAPKRGITRMRFARSSICMATARLRISIRCLSRH